MLKLSDLDYTPVNEQSSHRDALNQTTLLAQHADKPGFNRFWVSERHGNEYHGWKQS